MARSNIKGDFISSPVSGTMGWLAIPIGVALIGALIYEAIRPAAAATPMTPPMPTDATTPVPNPAPSTVSGARPIGMFDDVTLQTQLGDAYGCSRLPGDSISCARRLTLPSPIQQGYGGAWPYPGAQIELWPYDYLRKMYR